MAAAIRHADHDVIGVLSPHHAPLETAKEDGIRRGHGRDFALHASEWRDEVKVEIRRPASPQERDESAVGGPLGTVFGKRPRR